MSFTFVEYRRLLETCLAAGRTIIPVEEFLRGRRGNGPLLVLRHDVDRRVNKALAMARLEHELGVRATYYFRCGRRGFPADAIREIHRLGHYAGYHYETLGRCRGRVDDALALFEDELRQLRMIAPCATACRHGSPLSRHDSLELMDQHRLSRFALEGDAVLSFQGRALAYVTDTGGQWSTGRGRNNLRDSQPGSLDIAPPANTAEFLQLLSCSDTPFYVNTHPERWSSGPLDHLYCVALDTAANTAKRLIRSIRASQRGGGMTRRSSAA